MPEQLENTKDGINPNSRPMSPDSDSGVSAIQIKNVCSVKEVKSEPVSPVKNYKESSVSFWFHFYELIIQRIIIVTLLI